MRDQYLPSDRVIEEHLDHARKTASLPVWKRGLSIELLLGLRERRVDAELKRIAGHMPEGSTWEVGATAIREAVNDLSVRRLIRLSVNRGALCLAWAKFEPFEVETLIRELIPLLRSKPHFLRIPSSIYVTLCELVHRFGNSQVLSELGQLEPPTGWLQNAAFREAGGDLITSPPLVRTPKPQWLPLIPTPLMRDALTALLSRGVLFTDPHRLSLPEWSQYQPLPVGSVVLLDVDRMKQILDVHGMRTGDQVLVSIAECLQQLVGDRVVRFGGDELLILVEDKDAEEVAQAAVHAIRSLQVATVESSTTLIPVTVSAGVAAGTNATDTLMAAEEALNQAKLHGRDRVMTAARAT